MKNIRIVFTGGGSGGHTMPSKALISAFQKTEETKKIKIDFLYIGSYRGIEKEIITKLGLLYKGISTGKLRRYFSLKNFFDIFNIFVGLFQSFFMIKGFKADLLISTGGFVSIPPVISARLLKVPIIIHEQTINAGLANIIAGKFADIIALTFPESGKYFNADKTVVTGLPMRNEIFSGDKKRARKKLGIDPKPPLIYFTGGGLGCHILNETSLLLLPELLKKYSIVYQSGKSGGNNDYEELKRFRENLSPLYKKRLLVFDFVGDELADIYASADLAVSRSGAGTVCELAALSIPAVFIPLAIATKNEQFENADMIRRAGGAVLIEEKDLTAELLLKTINEAMKVSVNLKMKKSLKKMNIKNGSAAIVALAFRLLGEKTVK